MRKELKQDLTEIYTNVTTRQIMVPENMYVPKLSDCGRTTKNMLKNSILIPRHAHLLTELCGVRCHETCPSNDYMGLELADVGLVFLEIVIMRGQLGVKGVWTKNSVIERLLILRIW